MGVTRTLSPYGRSWGSRRGIHKRSFAETRPYIVNSVKWCMYHFLDTSCQWSRRPAPSGSAAPGGRPVSLRTRCVRSPRGLCIGTKAHKTKRREERDISVFWVIQRKAMNEVGGAFTASCRGRLPGLTSVVLRSSIVYYRGINEYIDQSRRMLKNRLPSVLFFPPFF